MLRPISIRPLLTQVIFTRSILTLILLTFLITGCSSTSLVYNNANWLIRSKIDDYFPLSDRQQLQLKADIGSVLQWHRQRELVEYSDLIIQFNEQYADGLTKTEINFFYDQLSSTRIRLVEESIPTASQFLSTVSVEQIDYYDQISTEKRTQKAKKLNASSEQFADENFARFIENMEQWFGGFNENQRSQLRIISDARPDNRQYWLKLSKLRQQEFSKLLRSRPSKEKIEQYLYDRFVGLSRIDVEEDDIRHKVRLYWLNSLSSIDKIIVTKQRNYFISRTSDYSSDFLQLSNQLNTSLIPSNQK